ncbi:MAG TPA: tetratricopeptide repeat protein [Ktedonobacteraceae bacterium]|nr:tetratricopeptide repeat protein [Ktedonobacteraceae bacterium]
MTRDENITLLLHRAHVLAPGMLLHQATQESQLQSAEIVDALEGLPLALDQAGAYIEETPCGLAHYLHLLKTHRKTFLKRRGRFPQNPPDPVTITWQISFQHIKWLWPASAELLHLCAFFDADCLPEELLTQGSAQWGPLLAKAFGDPLKLESLLEPLHRYALVRRSPETNALSLHPLVQEVVRQDLPLARQRQWATHVILALHRTFPDVKQETWDQCQRLLPQVLMAVQFCTQYKLVFPEAAQLFLRSGDFALIRRMLTHSERLFQTTLVLQQQLSSVTNPETAKGFHGLGELYRVWGRYAEAEPLLQQALAIYEQSPPSDPLEPVRTLNSLGELSHNLGRYQEAEARFQEALSLTERLGGLDHDETYTTLHHLTRLYHSQGRYGEAEQNYLKILRALEERLGPTYVDVAVLLSNLAVNYRKQGHLEKAEALLQRTLDIEEKAFGPEDHRVATILHNLGVIYQKQGHLDQAAGVFQRALDIKEASLGPKHLSSITTATNLANLLRMQKQYPAAKTLLQKALASDVGEEHPYTAVILRNLVRLLQEEGHDEEAQALSLRLLAIKAKTSTHSPS